MSIRSKEVRTFVEAVTNGLIVDDDGLGGIHANATEFFDVKIEADVISS